MLEALIAPARNDLLGMGNAYGLTLTVTEIGAEVRVVVATLSGFEQLVKCLDEEKT